MLCQFTDSQARPCLKDYINVPNVYPAGRLDRDSEGLVVLTDDGRQQQRISQPQGPSQSHPQRKMNKTYWVQVEGNPDPAALKPLVTGIKLKDGFTLPAKCKLIDPPYLLMPRKPPIRVRKNIPDTWLELTLSEGRNRQVRRMCAAVGFPVLRLLRYRVGSWTLDGLLPGEFRKLS